MLAATSKKGICVFATYQHANLEKVVGSYLQPLLNMDKGKSVNRMVTRSDVKRNVLFLSSSAN